MHLSPTSKLGYLSFRQASHYSTLSCNGSDRIRYETTGHRRESWHMTDIGTLAIHHLTLHDSDFPRLRKISQFSQY